VRYDICLRDQNEMSKPSLVDDSGSRRSRRSTRQPPIGSTHPIPTPRTLSPNTGPLAAASWLIARGLVPTEQRWFVEVTLTAADSLPENPTLLRIEIYSEEWGFAFHHDGKVSWIRVTDLPFVHGRDDHELLRDTPALKDLSRLVRTLEKRFGLRFGRTSPEIRSDIADAEPRVRRWASTL
jgi:hypothetical protein